MIMEYFVKKSAPHYSFLDTCKYGERDSCPIDQSSAQVHNIDMATGRPISDLTVVLRAQNKFEQEKILANLTEFKADYLPEGTSNEDAIKFSVPRYCQMPSELAELSERFTRQQLEEKRQKDAVEMAQHLAEERKKHLEELEKQVVESKTD